MKKLSLYLIATCLASHCYCQVLKDSSKAEEYNYYKTRADKQKRLGIILSSTGLATILASYAYGINTFGDESPGPLIGAIAGLGLTLSGIIIKLRSEQNLKKAKAFTTTFKMEYFSALKQEVVKAPCYPCVSVKFHL